MNIRQGPLTVRQRVILDHLLEGRRTPEIARLIHVSPAVVRQETSTIKIKFKAETLCQAVARYMEADALHRASVRVLGNRVVTPVCEAEEYANGVLSDVAALFVDWADQRMPK